MIGIVLHADPTVDRQRSCCPGVTRAHLDYADIDDLMVFELRCATCHRDLGILPKAVSNKLREWLNARYEPTELDEVSDDGE